MNECDILIVGAGITGLSIAKEISEHFDSLKVIIIDKENELAFHASGRNSGVIHAGFYYSADSLKAKFTAEGNRLLTNYCLSNGLSILRCGKVVVAKNEKEIELIDELKRRGDKNGVTLKVIDERELSEIEPNARTFRKALFSPSTSSINPKEILIDIANRIKRKEGFEVNLGVKYLKRIGKRRVRTSSGEISFKYLVNCAGLYADKIAHQYGVGRQYLLLPFKGLYLSYLDENIIQRHIYPVPDINNPFLGVHFTKTFDRYVKVGPTAIPSFWRENYKGLWRFNLKEFLETFFLEGKLFLTNSFNFRKIALEEIKKYSLKYLINKASALVNEIDSSKFGSYLPSGIRAQLFDKKKRTLEMDFVIEKSDDSVHILNAVSPAFTCAFSFSRFVVDMIKDELVKRIK